MNGASKCERDLPSLNELVEVIHRINTWGWCRVNSGNFSIRAGVNAVLISESGMDKSIISPQHFVRVDCQGVVLDPDGREPSVELPLHTQLYTSFSRVNAVLCSHSVNSTVFGQVFPDRSVCLRGYEIVKALPGLTSHEDEVFIPIFENTQDMARLSFDVDNYLVTHPHTPGYLIRGHGLYTWGNSVTDAMRYLEALEFLIECELSIFGLTGQWSGDIS